MKRAVVGSLVGLVLGVAIGWLLATEAVDDPGTGRDPSPSPPSAGAAPPHASELEQLREELAFEREMRAQLASELATLQDTSSADDGPSEGDTADPADKDSRPGASGAGGLSPEDPWFAEDELAALGMDAREIERVREAWERNVMARLEVEHRFARAEKGKAQNFKKLQHLMAAELRTWHELGDEGYDALLYASGQHNRVLMKDLLDSSPASLAGLMPGDEVISYDGGRVFRPRDLIGRTTTGEKGEWVEIEVVRDGRTESVYVQRGPLGARLITAKRPPRVD